MKTFMYVICTGLLQKELVIPDTSKSNIAL